MNNIVDIKDYNKRKTELTDVDIKRLKEIEKNIKKLEKDRDKCIKSIDVYNSLNNQIKHLMAEAIEIQRGYD